MPFTPISITNGTTPVNKTWGDNAQVQYAEATLSFEQDLFTPFVYSGGVATKDGVTVNQLDVTACVYFALQADLTLRRRSLAASTPGQYTTSTINTTYFLDFNPDGTTSFATSHSGQANFLPIAQVTTDGSGNISTVTDKRALNTTLLTSALGYVSFPGGIADTEKYADVVRDVAAGSLTNYYRLDETSGTAAADSSGYGETGTYVGSPTLNVTGALTGDTDAAITLSGSGQWVTFPSTNLSQGNGVFSVGCWVKISAAPSAFSMMVTWGATPLVNNTRVELAFNNTGKPYVAFGGGTGCTASGTVSNNVWHLIIGTYDGTNLNLYIDGSLSAGPTAAAAGAVGTGSAVIGANTDHTGLLTGSIDEVKIYNVALSAAQVTAIYNSGHNGPTTGPLGFVAPGGIQTAQSGSAVLGIPFATWNGSATIWPFSVGGRFKSALAWVDTAGNFETTGNITLIGSVIGQAGTSIPTTRNGQGLSVPIYTGNNSPSNPPTGAIWIQA